MQAAAGRWAGSVRSSVPGMTATGSSRFIDSDSGDDAWIGVGVSGERIGLTTSLSANGDLI